MKPVHDEAEKSWEHYSLIIESSSAKPCTGLSKVVIRVSWVMQQKRFRHIVRRPCDRVLMLCSLHLREREQTLNIVKICTVSETPSETAQAACVQSASRWTHTSTCWVRFVYRYLLSQLFVIIDTQQDEFDSRGCKIGHNTCSKLTTVETICKYKFKLAFFWTCIWIKSKNSRYTVVFEKVPSLARSRSRLLFNGYCLFHGKFLTLWTVKS